MLRKRSLTCHKVDTRMDDIQHSNSPKSKMVFGYRSKGTCCVLETNLTRKFLSNLATNFQDLVAKVKNLVALVPVLGAISRPACVCCENLLPVFHGIIWLKWGHFFIIILKVHSVTKTLSKHTNIQVCLATGW